MLWSCSSLCVLIEDDLENREPIRLDFLLGRLGLAGRLILPDPLDLRDHEPRDRFASASWGLCSGWGNSANAMLVLECALNECNEDEGVDPGVVLGSTMPIPDADDALPRRG